MRHAFPVAPRSYALHGRGGKVTASSEVSQLSFNFGLHEIQPIVRRLCPLLCALVAVLSAYLHNFTFKL
jgi:hypothetical protein